MAHLASRSSTTSPEALPRLPLTRCATALAGFLALLAQALVPLHGAWAQDRSLEDLIPDAAVEDPEGWAQGGDQPDIPCPDTCTQAEDELAADTPMEPMPLLTLEEPGELTLPEVEPIAATEEIAFETFADVIPPLPEGSEEQVSRELVLSFPTEDALFPMRKEFLARFRALSTIETLSDDGSQARLAAQARADEELLQRMLRVYGYFDAQVIRSVVAAEDREDAEPVARFDVIPGQRYTVGTVDLGDLAQAGTDYEALRASYEVFPGDLLSIDAIANERYDLDTALGESGYPFAAIGEPSLLVDHDRREGDVALPVTPNGKYVFGQITSSMEDFLSAHHLQDIARFEPGDTYRRSDEMDLRRALLATGLIGSVSLTPVEVSAPQGDAPGTVDIRAELTPAPLRTITGSIGYGTEEGIRLAGSWEHRNLFPSEGMLRVRGILGTQEQLAGVTFRKNNFNGRDRILTVDTYASTLDTDAYFARTASLTATYERVSTLLFQKPLSWGIGAELVATEQAEAKLQDVRTPYQTYFIAALPSYGQIDTSDDLLDPTRGYRLRGAVSPEISRLAGSNSTYLKSQFDLSYYRSVRDNVVLAARARLGTILGTQIANIAPSRRFYAGGGGSVRGYGYQSIGPVDDLGDPNGGRSLVEFSAEARIRTGLLDGAVSVVPFVDAGTVSSDTVPDFGDIRIGAGVGLRYHTGFGPLRLDVGVPLNREPGDAPVAVYVALGQSF